MKETLKLIISNLKEIAEIIFSMLFGTKFYRSIPKKERPKYRRYNTLYGIGFCNIRERRSLGWTVYFSSLTPEGMDFWNKHIRNGTLPVWSEEKQRFVDPDRLRDKMFSK